MLAAVKDGEILSRFFFNIWPDFSTGYKEKKSGADEVNRKKKSYIYLTFQLNDILQNSSKKHVRKPVKCS